MKQRVPTARVALKLTTVVIVLGILWLWFFGHHLNIRLGVADPWHPPATPASADPAAPRERCDHHDPLRRAWFGDIHVHTRYSMDAASRGMNASPDDAYRFAKGERVGFGPYDVDGRALRSRELEVPLDFAAVTDHAEWIGEISLCRTPESPVYNSQSCQKLRGRPRATLDGTDLGGKMTAVNGFTNRHSEICGPQDVRCRESLKTAWQEMQAAAERHYDRSSDCRFTTFHAYEYSNNVSLSKVHRNIIFRNERVPELPVSSLEEPEPEGLWTRLDQQCNNAGGACEVITIPHNPNVSNGRMFTVQWRDKPLQEQQALARQRAAFEPVVEMMQIKGESECRLDAWNVLGEDELCDFEKIRQMPFARDSIFRGTPADCENDYSLAAVAGLGCQSRLDFVRYALIEGMVEEQRIGINPYRFGFVGSTDNHNGAPGDVSEADYEGCCANSDVSAETRLESSNGFAGKPPAARNPGGLMGVWAEENSRDALFDAMLRREVFATSGPRISPRFFAGDLPDDLCEKPANEMADIGYQHGTPMGGVLEPTGESPQFVASAVADPHSLPLQRLQIIKVWHDDEGLFHQQVVDVAGDASSGASVDIDSCRPKGDGAYQLCGSWRDPAFNPSRPAAYYVRAVENPGCRWSWYQCVTLKQQGVAEKELPAVCLDPGVPKVIQERAWSSPIWVAGVPR